MFRKLAVAILVGVGLLFWAIGVVCLGLTTQLTLLGRRVAPDDSTYGNCWTYALPRYHKHGGYLLVRPAQGVRVLGFKVPHVAWISELPIDGLVMEAFDPLDRKVNKWVPWRVVWYHGQVINYERRRKPRD